MPEGFRHGAQSSTRCGAGRTISARSSARWRCSGFIMRNRLPARRNAALFVLQGEVRESTCFACRRFWMFLVRATHAGAQAGCVSGASGKVFCGQPDSSCAVNRQGEVVCTSPGGGMRNDTYGELLCGPGYCVTDQQGNALCSSVPQRGGHGRSDWQGGLFRGCVPATKDACVQPVSPDSGSLGTRASLINPSEKIRAALV